MPTLTSGRKTVATGGTAEKIAASARVVSLTVVAETDNTGKVVVGGSDVVAALSTRKGIPLNAGDSVAFEEHEIDDLGDVWLDVETNGDGVTYVAVTP